MKPTLIFTDPKDHMGCIAPPKEYADTALPATSYLTAEVGTTPEYLYYEQGWWPPPNLDQGALPACTIFAAATAQQDFEIRERGQVQFRYHELVRVFNQIRVNRGAYMHDAIKIWEQEGIPGHAIVLSWLEKIRWWGGWRSYKFKIGASTWLGTPGAQMPAQVRRCLYAYKGLGYACLAITDRFFRFGPKDIVCASPGEQIIGYHAMAAVGYTPQGVIVAHTWGDRPRQIMGWDYWKAWCCGMYLVIDAKDMALGTRLRKAVKSEPALLDLTKLRRDQKRLRRETCK